MGNDWTKSADWIPYTNAVAQVNVYLEGIASAEKSLMILDIMGVDPNDAGYKLTVEEIKRKEERLKVAQYKVARSFKRLSESDKITWADKLKKYLQ